MVPLFSYLAVAETLLHEGVEMHVERTNMPRSSASKGSRYEPSDEC